MIRALLIRRFWLLGNNITSSVILSFLFPMIIFIFTNLAFRKILVGGIYDIEFDVWIYPSMVFFVSGFSIIPSIFRDVFDLRIHKKVLTISDCKNILKDVFNQAKVITVDKIQNTVSNFFSIPLAEMLSQRRSRPLARPRQIAMFLAKKMTTRSLPEIGRRFANRDHTTVIHAVKTITRISEKDDEMKKNINHLKSLLLEE